MTTEKPQFYECQDCGEIGPESHFRPAADIYQRIAPGDIYTDKECRACGALAHLTDGPVYTVQCVFARYYYNTVQVKAPTVSAACAAAIEDAGADDGWKECDEQGPTFITDVVPGKFEKVWEDGAKNVDFPGEFTEFDAIHAAAPEMLDALKLAQATIERLAIQHGPFNSADGTKDVIRAAIATAERKEATA